MTAFLPELPQPATPEWLLYVRDDQLRRVAQIDEYEKAEATRRFNAVGSWALTLDRRSAAAAALLRPGYGIEITCDGAPFLAGPTTKPRATRTEGSWTATFGGVDDMVWLRRRLVSPQPGSSGPPYSSAEYDVRSGAGSTVLRGFVDANCGPGAVATRRYPGLTLDPDPLIGSAVVGRGRWQVLLDLLTDLATEAGGLGFQVVQNGAALRFGVFAPVDRSDQVVFSEGLGTLAGYDLTREVPDSTHVVVGGGGEGTARVIVERDSADAATWGRIEKFVDRRDTSDVAELTTAGDAALTEDGETLSLGATPVDTVQQTFGTHYQLGDRVSVLVDDDPTSAVSELIREATVTLTPDAARVVPTIGTPGRHDLLRIAAAMRDLSARLRDLERR